MNIKLTPAQVLVLNGLLSLLGTAVVAAISASYQYYTTGAVGVGSLINYTVVTFAVLFSKALHDYVPDHAQVLIQSLQDTYNESQDALHSALHTVSIQANSPVVQVPPAALQAQPQPVTVVIHTTGTPDVAQSVTPVNTVDPMATPMPAHLEALSQSVVYSPPLQTPQPQSFSVVNTFVPPTNTGGLPDDTMPLIVAAQMKAQAAGQ